MTSATAFSRLRPEPAGPGAPVRQPAVPPVPGGLAGRAVAELGFGPVFRRMWDLCLAYSEAGFRAGYLGVHQLLPERCAL